MAPLQKRALYSLVIGLAFTAVLIAVLVARGDVTSFEQDPGLRLIIYVVLIGVPLVYLAMVNITLRRPTQIDERDRLIIEKTSRAQYLAVVFSIVVWTISLTEVYNLQRQVPVAFLNLILISTLILSSLAQSIGILLGYARPDHVG